MTSTQRWRVSDTWWMLLFFSRVFCLAPVRFSRNRSVISFPWLLKFFTVLAVTVIQLYMAYESYKFMTKNWADVILAIEKVLHMTIILYGAMKNETRISNYMLYDEKIYKIIRSLQIHKEKSSILRDVMLMTSFHGLTVILIILHDIFYSKETSIEIEYDLLIETILINTLQLQFVYMAYSISVPFKIITNQLQMQLSQLNNSESKLNIPLVSIDSAVDTIVWDKYIRANYSNLTRRNIAERIAHIRNSFVETCDVMKEFNSSDNVLLFFLVISLIFSIALTMYNLLMLQQDNTTVYAKLVLQILWCLYYATKIMLLVEPCYLTQKMIGTIRLLVAEMLSCVTSEGDPIYFEVDIFFKQLVLNNVQYTALEMFNVGRPLIPTIIGTITTILLVLFQF